MRKFARDTIDHVIEALGSDLREGLSGAEVASRRKVHGLNKLEEEQKVRMRSVLFKTLLLA